MYLLQRISITEGGKQAQPPMHGHTEWKDSMLLRDMGQAEASCAEIQEFLGLID